MSLSINDRHDSVLHFWVQPRAAQAEAAAEAELARSTCNVGKRRDTSGNGSAKLLQYPRLNDARFESCPSSAGSVVKLLQL